MLNNAIHSSHSNLQDVNEYSKLPTPGPRAGAAPKMVLQEHLCHTRTSRNLAKRRRAPGEMIAISRAYVQQCWCSELLSQQKARRCTASEGRLAEYTRGRNKRSGRLVEYDVTGAAEKGMRSARREEAVGNLRTRTAAATAEAAFRLTSTILKWRGGYDVGRAFSGSGAFSGEVAVDVMSRRACKYASRRDAAGQPGAQPSQPRIRAPPSTVSRYRHPVNSWARCGRGDRRRCGIRIDRTGCHEYKDTVQQVLID
ncbi:hypothetical protein C8Q74DRAFT_120094 [Fomes fomentarius]|nr:hypothetical protein C8Q74DRAFT_120094 [Fomes fomentarius]